MPHYPIYSSSSNKPLYTAEYVEKMREQYEKELRDKESLIVELNQKLLDSIKDNKYLR